MRYSLLFFICIFSCFKKKQENPNALFQQKSCIESLEIKDFERAKTHCELCLEYDKSMPECLNGLGLIYLEEKDEEKAKSFFKRAIRQNNNFSDARNNLGVVFFLNSEFYKALEYFDKSLQINPSNLDARYNSALSSLRIAQNLLAKHEKEKVFKYLLKAKSQLLKLTSLEPTYHSAFRDLGLVYLSFAEIAQVKEEEAEFLRLSKENFLTCLKVNKEEAGCYEGLGLTENKRANFDEAFSYFFQCLGYEPNNVACKKGIVETYENSSKSETSFKSLENTIANNQSNYVAYEAFCSLLFEKGFVDLALNVCERAIRIKPDLCLAHFKLAEHFAFVLNAERAKKHCHALFLCDQKDKFLIEQKKCEEIINAIKRG